MTNFFVFIVITVSILFIVYLTYLLIFYTNTTTREKELQISLEDMLKQIAILFRQQKYEIVENVAHEYLKSKPDAVEIREYLAKAYFSREKVYDSISATLQILEKEPHNVAMRILLAKCYKKINQLSKAINEFKIVLEYDSSNLVAIRELADVYLVQNQKISAIKMYKKLENYVENNAELSKIKMILAGLHVDLEDYSSAFEELIHLKETYPDEIEINKKLIELYIKTKDLGNAIILCDDLLLSSRDKMFSLWLLQNLVNIYFAQKNYDRTLEYANQMLEHPFSDKVEVKALIANVHILNGNYEQGLDLLLILADNNRNNVEIRRMVAKAYLDRKDFAAAVATYKDILNLVPPREVSLVHTDMSNLYTDWAMHLFEEEDYSECFKIFTLATQYDEVNPNIYFELGKVNMHIKSYNEAISQFKKSLELNPIQPECYLFLAECYEIIENIYEEKNALLHTIKYDEENIFAYYKLAGLYAKQRDVGNEISSLQKVIEFDPKHIGAKHQLALIYEGQGQINEAIEIYESILKLEPENKAVIENLTMLKEST